MPLRPARQTLTRRILARSRSRRIASLRRREGLQRRKGRKAKAKRKKRCVRSRAGWLRAERSETGFAVSSKRHLSDKSFTTENAEGNRRKRKGVDRRQDTEYVSDWTVLSPTRRKRLHSVVQSHRAKNLNRTHVCRTSVSEPHSHASRSNKRKSKDSPERFRSRSSTKARPI